jgi:hypothetical protein
MRTETIIISENIIRVIKINNDVEKNFVLTVLFAYCALHVNILKMMWSFIRLLKAKC